MAGGYIGLGWGGWLPTLDHRRKTIDWANMGGGPVMFGQAGLMHLSGGAGGSFGSRGIG
jgi:hypothetical protein